MTLTQRLGRLHVGQVGIILFTAGLAVAFLTSVRSRLAADHRIAKWSHTQTGTTLHFVRDSLRTLAAVDPEDQLTAILDAPLVQTKQRLTVREQQLQTLLSESLARRNEAGAQLIAVTTVIGAIIATSLSMLWMWFGTRTPQAPALAPPSSPSTSSLPTASASQNTSPRPTKAVVRFFTYLLLLVLGIIMFRLGDLLVTAIRSR